MAKRGEKRPTRGIWVRRTALAIGPVVALSGAMIALALDHSEGIGTMFGLREQAREARSRVGHMEAEKRRLSALVHGLRSDPDQIEVAVRLRLGMLRRGEVVVRMPSVRKR